MLRRRAVLTALLALSGLMVMVPVQAEEAKAQKVRIGFVNSLFADGPAAFSAAVLDVFGRMVHAQTGLDAEVLRGGDAFELSDRLDEDLHFGILQGVEFAWALEKDPKLRPLILAINDNPRRHGLLVVRADSKAVDFADLKGKSLIMPLHSRAHAELFLTKACGKKDFRDAKDYFSPFQRSDNAEDALDDLVDGDVQGVVLDAVAFERYQERKPGRAAKLKVLKKSEPFPASVIAYRPDNVDAKRLQIFRDGLMSSSKSVAGRYLMTLWKLSAFEPVPDEYDGLLTNIRKAYPSPK